MHHSVHQASGVGGLVEIGTTYCSRYNEVTHPLRTGAAGAVYVLPAPQPFNLRHGVQIFGGCAIATVLLMPLVINQKTKATSKETHINFMLNADLMLSFLELSVLTYPVLVVLFISEKDFWSMQVAPISDEMHTIGRYCDCLGSAVTERCLDQWSSIVVTCKLFFIAPFRSMPYDSARPYGDNHRFLPGENSSPRTKDSEYDPIFRDIHQVI